MLDHQHMTNKQYVRSRGTACPVCRGKQVEGDGVDIEGGRASQIVRCGRCGSEWRDRYRLIGYELIADNSFDKSAADS